MLSDANMEVSVFGRLHHVFGEFSAGWQMLPAFFGFDHVFSSNWLAIVIGTAFGIVPRMRSHKVDCPKEEDDSEESADNDGDQMLQHVLCLKRIPHSILHDEIWICLHRPGSAV